MYVISLLLLSRFSRVRLVRPRRRQPIRLPHPWDSLGKNTGVGCHFLLQCIKAKSQSEVSQSCLTYSDPMDCIALNRCWGFLGSSVIKNPLANAGVYPKGNQSWVFIGRTDVEAETLILWLPDMKSWLIRKDPDAGKDWGQEEKGMTEDEMVGFCNHLSFQNGSPAHSLVFSPSSFLQRLRAGEEEGNRGWDGWTASSIQWTWVWANSGT